ncbi:GNAT family N-acetyltransferase [Ruegeria sp. Ofav3-42]|uniref:GNAT family N-acetyltransferase n=1 Tax=Ruegeria sp. Ofav3-42 TaxID=2917759 RepID=UPI001EF41598|nr:GNAT family N-acetyltransferase [Ruegeria sp. Ofav3-42]MCG7520150.1 GNAT family N-acetyltransferase [Ruegeria sp. Ofav3-42]
MTPHDLADTHAAAFTQSRPWTAEEFADLLSNKFTHVVGNAKSFALFQVIADEAELLTIATHPDSQRQGQARKRMQEWHSKAKVLGATRAFLDVAADNLPAIALYTHFGYRPCGSRKGYYLRENNQKIDAILMDFPLE